MSDELTPKLIEIECLLEGLKIPIASFEIREEVGTPPSCTLGFPAHSGALRILPGTLVHVFGLVEFIKDAKRVREKVLLFEGEVAGQGYDKTPNSRTVSLTCQSLLHKWSDVFLQSADFLSDRIFMGALYIYQDWSYYDDTQERIFNEDTEEYEFEKKKTNVQDPDNIVTPKEAKEKYMRFSYDHTLGAGWGWEMWLINSLTGSRADKDAISRGDWIPFFYDLIQHLEFLNLYHGLFAKTFRLTDTIFIFPNIKVEKMLVGYLAGSLGTGKTTEMSERVTILDAISTILSIINYSLVMPAAPTYTINPILSEEDGGLGDQGQSPMRAYMLPDLWYSIPITNNIIFPEQVRQFSYTRNMSGEPTRLFMGIPPVSAKISSKELEDIGGAYVSPGLAICNYPTGTDYTPLGNEESAFLFQFLPEETHRGVRPARGQFSGMERKFIHQLSKPPSEGSDDESKQADAFSKNSVPGLAAFNISQLSFQKMRFSTRQCSISAEWSPFRIVGLPAVFFDTDGSPSVFGTLHSHTMTVDANGSATSSMVLTNSRVLYDWEGLDHIADIVSGKISNKSIKTLKDKKTINKHVMQFNAMNADPIPFLPDWYDNRWYDSAHVGRDVYSIISDGKVSRFTEGTDEETKADCSWNNEAQDPEPSMLPYEDKFKNSNLRGQYVDYSIMRYIRKSNDAKFIMPSGLKIDPENDTENIVMAKRVSAAVRALKNKYQEAKDSGKLKNFILSSNSRRLTTQSEYFRFLGIDERKGPKKDDDYRLTKKGDYVEGVSVVEVRKLLEKFLAGETWAQNKDSLKVFVQKRMQQVELLAKLAEDSAV